MTKVGEIYRCELCGNVVSIIEDGAGELVCCGESMDILFAKTGEQEGKEKHVPVVTIEEDKVIVNVGSVDHPMEDDHFIELIQLVKGGIVIAERHLKAGDKPHAEFIIENSDGVTAREICNLHGLWSN